MISPIRVQLRDPGGYLPQIGNYLSVLKDYLGNPVVTGVYLPPGGYHPDSLHEYNLPVGSEAVWGQMTWILNPNGNWELVPTVPGSFDEAERHRRRKIDESIDKLSDLNESIRKIEESNAKLDSLNESLQKVKEEREQLHKDREILQEEVSLLKKERDLDALWRKADDERKIREAVALHEAFEQYNRRLVALEQDHAKPQESTDAMQVAKPSVILTNPLGSAENFALGTFAITGANLHICLSREGSHIWMLMNRERWKMPSTDLYAEGTRIALDDSDEIHEKKNGLWSRQILSADSKKQGTTARNRMTTIKEELQTDIPEAAVRTAVKQLTKLARDPLVAMITKEMEGDEAFRNKMAALFKTDLGLAMIQAMIATGMMIIPGVPSGPRTDALIKELRVSAMANGMDVAADTLMAPIRQIMMLALQDPKVSAVLQLEPASAEVLIPETKAVAAAVPTPRKPT